MTSEDLINSSDFVAMLTLDLRGFSPLQFADSAYKNPPETLPWKSLRGTTGELTFYVLNHGRESSVERFFCC